jgi:hypothetical protein
MDVIRSLKVLLVVNSPKSTNRYKYLDIVLNLVK